MEMLLQLLSSGTVVYIADVDTPGVHVHLLLEAHVELGPASCRQAQLQIHLLLQLLEFLALLLHGLDTGLDGLQLGVVHLGGLVRVTLPDLVLVVQLVLDIELVCLSHSFNGEIRFICKFKKLFQVITQLVTLSAHPPSASAFCDSISYTGGVCGDNNSR